MSYILDALKKADAERAREATAVPDLYAQADAERGARAAARWPVWSVALLGVVALALLMLVWRWFAAPAEPAVAQQAPSAMPAVQPSAVPAPMPTPQAAPVAAVPSAAPAMLAKSAAPAKPAASAPINQRLPTLAELPPNLRSQLPALAVGGSMYSPNPASRMVILNGQVFREGDQLVDGLDVERIGLKSTVLVYRGTRFELKH